MNRQFPFPQLPEHDSFIQILTRLDGLWQTTCKNLMAITVHHLAMVQPSIHTSPGAPKWRIIAANIAHNLRYRMRTWLGHFDTEHGATHRSLTVEESVRYIHTVFSDYLSFGGLSADSLNGMRILEVGPGDNCGVALLFLAAGAAEVTCLDKFYAIRDEQHQRAIYFALRNSLCETWRERFDSLVSISTTGLHVHGDRLRVLHGVPVEEAPHRFPAQSFDLIASRAVVMEFADPDRAFDAMNLLLKPQGVVIHKVAALNDYQMFRQHGYHPLEFLTVPETLYKLMVTDSGKPNRQLLDYYQSRFQTPEYDSTVHLVQLLGSGCCFPPGVTTPPQDTDEYRHAVELVRRIRPRLARQFRSAEIEHLVFADFFVVARKLASVVQGSVKEKENSLCPR